MSQAISAGARRWTAGPTPFVAGIVATAVGAIVVAQLSMGVFAVAVGLLVAEVALASLRWPRAVLIGVVLSPILDRYLLPGLLPPDAEQLAHLLSEALLVAVGTALVVQAVGRGSLHRAIDHPTVWLGVGLVMLSVASAVVNAAPPTQALAGIIFTVDAMVLFILARIVGYDPRQALASIGAFLALIVAGALVAVAQAILSPNLLGLTALTGRFGELYRLAAIFGDPNTFAAFLSAAIPFALFGATGLWTLRGRRIALGAGFLLLLALWLSYSRGGWLGAIGGFVIGGLLVDRRAVAVGVLVAVIAFATAVVLPRDLLGPTGEKRPDVVGSTIGRVETVSAGGDLRVLFIVNALPILADHPILGVGPGMYGGAAADLFGTPVYARYGTDRLFSSPTQRTVDDFWLHLLVETGLLGLLTYWAMILAALTPIMRSARRAAGGRRVALAGIAVAAICLAFNSLTTMLLEANSVAFAFWFLLGIGTQLAWAPANESSRADDRILAAQN